MKQMKLAIFAASTVLGLAVLPATSFAQQVTPGGAGERHANETPGASTKAVRPAPAPRGAAATTGSQTPSDPAAIGTSGRDKQTGAPKNKD
jgi:type IV secretory pathway VirB6-like protein